MSGSVSNNQMMDGFMVKFYVGEMSSHWCGGQEVHILERLDFVLSAESESVVAFIDSSLRQANMEFIRSDNKFRTLFEMGTLEAA